MKYLILTLTLLFSSFLIYSQNATKIAKKGRKSTVSVIALDKNDQPLSYGSGFIIANGIVVTNLHVINGAQSVYIKNGEKKHSVDGYIEIDTNNDLITLKSNSLKGIPLKLGANEIPEIGSEIYAIGNPKGLSGTVSKGIISGIREKKEDKLLQITSPISPGSSGGPILNNKGEVIGIAFASYQEGQNLNFAIPVTYLSNIKNSNSSPKEISSLKINKPDYKETESTKKGVIIRNIRKIHGGMSLSFSIKNNLSHPISDIQVIFIFYDKTGTVIHYDQYELATYSKIKPHLAKTYGERLDFDLQVLNSASDIESRVLNFKILKSE